MMLWNVIFKEWLQVVIHDLHSRTDRPYARVGLQRQGQLQLQARWQAYIIAIHRPRCICPIRCGICRDFLPVTAICPHFIAVSR